MTTESSSLLQELLQSFPQLRAQVYFKASLTALSHAIEDLVLAGTEQPLVIANFQQERYYRQEAARYQRIGQHTDRVYVLAAPETDFASAPAPYATIGIAPTDPLAQEWHLAIVGKSYSACLICREYAAPVDTIDLDSARQFRGFWTFDADVSKQAAVLLLDRIVRYRPDLTEQIDLDKHRYQLTARAEEIELGAQPFPADAGAFAVLPLGELADVAFFIDGAEEVEVAVLMNAVDSADAVVVVAAVSGDADACAYLKWAWLRGFA